MNNNTVVKTNGLHTYDKHTHCTIKWTSGWWYNGCYHIYINRQPPEYDYPNDVLFIEIKVWPKDSIIQ